MIARGFTILAWLAMLLGLPFARLPNEKAGDWTKEILERIKEKIKERTEHPSEERKEEDKNRDTEQGPPLSNPVNRA